MTRQVTARVVTARVVTARVARTPGSPARPVLARWGGTLLSASAPAGGGKTLELGTNGKGTSSTRAAIGAKPTAASSRWGTASPREDFFRSLFALSTNAGEADL